MNNSPDQPQPQASAPAKIKDDKRQARHELNEIVGGAQEILVRAKTVFPLTIFPDTLTLDRTKVTITHREFFRVAEVMSIRIEDILNVTAHVGPLFGSIKIATRFFDHPQ